MIDYECESRVRLVDSKAPNRPRTSHSREPRPHPRRIAKLGNRALKGMTFLYGR
jgi:hypothetical protein